MSHLTIFPGVPIPAASKVTASQPLQMSPVSDSLACSTPGPDDDMFAWLAPPSQEFDQSTPPRSPSISISDDPLLFDIDMGSETDPVTPNALFTMSDLMDVDGHGMTFHHGIDSDFDLGLPQRDSKDRDAMENSILVSDVLSETQDSLTSANEDIKATPPRPIVPNVHLTIPEPSLSQTIENITLEPRPSPSLPHLNASESVVDVSPTAKRSPKRSPSRKGTTKGEAPVAAITKVRGSSVHREHSVEKQGPTALSDVMKGVKPLQVHRKRARTAVVGDETRKGGSNTLERDGKFEGAQTKAAKGGIRFRRKGAEKRMGKVVEDEKNVPAMDRCVKCSTTAKNTPMMRKGPDGCRSLCNACGLKWSRHGIF